MTRRLDGCCMFVAWSLIISIRCTYAADWPTFRGPEGNGIAHTAKLATTWSDTQNVTWRTALPGLGWSSPVVAKERIYLTTAVPHNASADNASPPQATGEKDYALRLVCLEAKSGSVVWDVKIFDQLGAKSPKIHTKNSHASPTAIVDGNRVFVHFGHKGTACVGTDGTILWKNEQLSYEPVHGNGGTPILVDDLLIFSCDGGSDPFVVALNADTGKVAWKVARPGNAAKKFSFSTPTLISVNGQRQVISPGSDVVSAYNPANGEEIWRVYYDGYSVIPKPVVAHGLVFICTGYNTPSLLAIRTDGSGDVTNSHVAWTMKRGVPHSASLLSVGDELYMVADAGIASCVDARTGKLHWQERISGNFSASPIFAGGQIYFQSEQGEATVIEPGTKFKVVAKNSLNQRTLASYAVVDQTLFIRSESHLYRID